MRQKRLVQQQGQNAGVGVVYGQWEVLPLVAGVVVGMAVFATLAMAAALYVFYRRAKQLDGRHRAHSARTKLLVPTAKPVISFKTAAGPGGLKKSPSPVQSPEEGDGWRQTSAASSSCHSQMATSHQSTPTMDDLSPSATVKPLDAAGQQVVKMNFDNIEGKRGELNFCLRYCFDKNALQVNIVSATNLPALQQNGNEQLLDPYVKLQLLPEKQHKVKTRVVKNTVNAIYDEEFTFYGITYNQLQSTTLHFAVVAFDRYSRDEIVGEVICPLHNVDLTDADKQASLSMDLVSHTSKFQNAQNRGELLVSLCYQPATNKITVVVLKGKNFPKFDITGLADPYVKVYMLYNGQRIGKKKTHVKKRTLTPVYNESFVFDLPVNDPAILDQVSFEYLVMDWDRVTKNEVMGRMTIGLTAKNTTGKSHWDQVRRNPRRQIAEWHRLRP